ncbi:hypothetical protein CFC21_070834 [Triticum aestivum]|uniref:Protein PEP-RELATED DEVELOPMENT ARRESTED 1, chloroplastic n=3 Tax=Triticum TaxID=4564 RepID=A0A9R0X0F6_TRITD|nr:hypothetical protein CFC21_070834 [Triticum aestivum]VAI27779.1 unnamed protein product [Triticum turgidum subsp. durum]
MAALSLSCTPPTAVLPCLPRRPAASLLRPRVPSRPTLVVCLGAKPKVPLPIASPSPLVDDPAKWDPAECDALLRGGEQVASVLQEMLTLMEDMEMDGAFAPVVVELVAQGVIGNRVDEMESGFLMALDYMIQLAQKDGDDERNSLLEVVKQTVLDHLTKKCPPHVQVVGLLCQTEKKESRHELLRRVAAGGGVFENDKGLKCQIPGANLNDIANQADDLLEVNFLSKLVALKPGKAVEKMISDVMHGKEEGADNTESTNTGPNSDLEPSTGTSGRENATGRKPQPVRPGMFLETVSKVLGGIYAKNTSGITAQHLEWVHQTTLKILQEMAF